MCGIFGYYNFKVSRDRRAIMEILFNGLRRLEYRGYDSAGIAIDADELTQQYEKQPASNGVSRLGDPSLVSSPAGVLANGVEPLSSVRAGVSANGVDPPSSVRAGGGNLCAPATKSSAESSAAVSCPSSAFAAEPSAEPGAALPCLVSCPSSEVSAPGLKRCYSGGVGRDYKGRMSPVPLVIKSAGKVDALVKLAYQQLLHDDVCLDRVRSFALLYLE